MSEHRRPATLAQASWCATARLVAEATCIATSRFLFAALQFHIGSSSIGLFEFA